MLKRFDGGSRLSEMAIHNGVAYLAGQVPADAKQDIRGQDEELNALAAPVTTATPAARRKSMGQIGQT
jgi:enamine deaminase RidA (YjgF/YER057c/UK114 family)